MEPQNTSKSGYRATWFSGRETPILLTIWNGGLSASHFLTPEEAVMLMKQMYLYLYLDGKNPQLISSDGSSVEANNS